MYLACLSPKRLYFFSRKQFLRWKKRLMFPPRWNKEALDQLQSRSHRSQSQSWTRTRIDTELLQQNISCAPDNLRAENWQFGGDWGSTSEPVKQKLKWIARIYKPKDSQNDVKWYFPSVYLFQWIQILFVILQFSIINTQTVGKSILAKPKGSSWGRREKSIQFTHLVLYTCEVLSFASVQLRILFLTVCKIQNFDQCKIKNSDPLLTKF